MKNQTKWSILVLSLLLSVSQIWGQTVPELKNGILNLTDWNPKTNPILKLDGEWLFAPGKWIETPDESTIPIRLKDHRNWDSYNTPPLPGEPEIGTYFLTIHLPKNPIPLGIRVNKLDTNARFLSNGVNFFNYGDITDSDEKMYRKIQIQELPPSPTGEILLVVQVKNKILPNGGIWSPILLGDANYLEQNRQLHLSKEGIIIGALLILGLYQLGHYIVRSKMKSSLYFFLFCLGLAVRVSTTGERVWFSFLDVSTSNWTFRFELISLYFSVSVGFLYFYSISKLRLPRWITPSIIIPNIALTMVCFWGSIYTMSKLLIYGQILELIVIGIILYLLTLYCYRRESSWMLLLSSVLILIGFTCSDVLSSILTLNLPEVAPYGMLTFVLLQALFLSKRFNEEILSAEKNLKSAQYQLVQSEKMSALGVMVAGVAHEINSPLSAIKSSASLLEERLPLLFQNYPNTINQLSANAYKSIMKLVDQSQEMKDTISTKEFRSIKKNLTESIEKLGVEDPEEIADFLASIGYKELTSDIQSILSSTEERKIIFQLSQDFIQLIQNTQTIQLASERAGKIVLSLKSFTHFDPNAQKKLTSVQELIETVLVIYANSIKKGIDLIQEYEDVPPIPCYPDELNQVWTNLIQNAIQAMDGKGSLTIRVGKEFLQNKPFVFAEFLDSGKGIPKEILEKIFDPFFTTKAIGEGTGLGLHITKQIIEKHKGEIHVESQTGRTKFKISLPMEG